MSERKAIPFSLVAFNGMTVPEDYELVNGPFGSYYAPPESPFRSLHARPANAHVVAFQKAVKLVAKAHGEALTENMLRDKKVRDRERALRSPRWEPKRRPSPGSFLQRAIRKQLDAESSSLINEIAGPIRAQPAPSRAALKTHERLLRQRTRRVNGTIIYDDYGPRSGR